MPVANNRPYHFRCQRCGHCYNATYLSQIMNANQVGCDSGCGYSLTSIAQKGRIAAAPKVRPKEVHVEGVEIDLDKFRGMKMPELVKEEGVVNVEKGGESLTYISVRRAYGGIRLDVRVHPAVEEFMKSLGNGTTKDVNLFAKGWEPADKNDPAMEVYQIGDHQIGGDLFTLNSVGTPLYTPDPNVGGDAVVNLSFLRIVGTSKGQGVSFVVRGVYSIDRLQKLQNDLANSIKKLYREYIKGTDLTIVVSTQQIP